MIQQKLLCWHWKYSYGCLIDGGVYPLICNLQQNAQCQQKDKAQNRKTAYES